ncbi:MAG: primosomal protein N' [Clostridia bacterium]|nr:primosomal protein N' [Clostridia bacterium]MBQ7289072.1 primosomal protein N' [Clostridia bacterium]
MGNWIVGVAVNQKIYHIDKLYDYLVPASFVTAAQPGKRVLVPFGNSNRAVMGMIMHMTPSESATPLKSILSVVDENPVLNDEMLQMVSFLKERTYCTFYSAVQQLLPAGAGHTVTQKYLPAADITPNTLPKLSSEMVAVMDCLFSAGTPLSAERIAEKTGIADCEIVLQKLCKRELLVRQSTTKQNTGLATVKMVRLPERNLEVKLTKKQQAVFDSLSKIGCASIKELCYFTGVGVSVITNMVNKGYLIAYDIAKYRMPYHFAGVLQQQDIQLTAEQEKAYQQLLSDYVQPKSSVSLLFGVTGSGKTQVFLKMVDRCLTDGKTAIVMVPEISLTPQTLHIFSRRYGDDIAVFHSAMSRGQRLDEWRRVKEGKVRIVIGTRSAVFAPLENIGLIVMDEEQEGSYKSEKSPRFHAADIAKYRTRYHNALLILSSATPSIETYSKAKAGIYHLATISNRYGGAVLPEVITVDMRKELSAGNSSVISRYLADELQTVLDAKKQAILLLNRRGHNTFVSCSVCNHVLTCDSCSISLTYHSANNRLVCHYCGKSIPFVQKCPSCGNEHVRYAGQGTQKAEIELRAMYPSARILRMDADSTMTRSAFEEKIRAFSEKEYDIMIGTQMVAKGLDFPDVTLVGVLNSDQSLYSDDFRSFEKTFSLLTQVVGRSGRGNAKGKAIIQTNDPDNEIIRFAANQDYAGFYENEILTRRLMVYPPFCDLTVAYVLSDDCRLAEEGASFVAEYIKEKIGAEFADVKMIALGPILCSVPRINNKYRYRVIFKHKINASAQRLFSALMLAFAEQSKYKNATLVLDANPESII